MDWLVWYFIINVVMAVIVYSGWGYVEKSTDMQELYNQYGRKTTRIMMTIVFCFIGAPMLALGISGVLLGVIGSLFK